MLVHRARLTRRSNICSILRSARHVPRGALPHGAQPRLGDAVSLVAQPVHRLRPSVHVLLRAGVRGARRPRPGRGLRPLDPRQGQRGRGAATRARAALLGARGGDRRRGHRPVPARGGSLPAHARLPRRARRAAGRPFSLITRGPLVVRDLDVLQDAARARARRRARLGADARRPRLANDRAGHRAAGAQARRRAAAGRGGDRRRRGRGPGPPRPLRPARTSSQPSCALHAQPAHGRSGPPCSTSGRARASTSSRLWRATGPRSSSATSASTDGRAYLPDGVTRPVRETVRRLAAETAAPRRPVLRPAPQPAQLTARRLGAALGSSR